MHTMMHTCASIKPPPPSPAVRPAAPRAPIVRRLVLDDRLVALQREAVEVDRAHGRRRLRRQVEQLAQLRLPGHLVEELQQAQVLRRAAKELLEHLEQVRLQQEAVVDGRQAHLGDLVPAGLAAARDAAVHDVVRDEEEGLQPLDAPAEHGGAVRLGLGHRRAADGLQHVHDREPAVELAAGHVVVDHLGHPVRRLARQRVQREHLIDEVRLELLEHLHEVLARAQVEARFLGVGARGAGLRGGALVGHGLGFRFR